MQLRSWWFACSSQPYKHFMHVQDWIRENKFHSTGLGSNTSASTVAKLRSLACTEVERKRNPKSLQADKTKSTMAVSEENLAWYSQDYDHVSSFQLLRRQHETTNGAKTSSNIDAAGRVDIPCRPTGWLTCPIRQANHQESKRTIRRV